MSEPLSNRLHELRNVCCTSQRTLQDQKRPNGLTATSVAGQVVSVALHDRLEELCRRLGVKPTKLGVDAGLSTYTVNNWIKKSKSGKPLPGRTRELEQLARHYGYDVSWFTEAQPERRPGDLPESFGVSVAVVDQVARDLQADGVSYEQAIRAILAVADSGAPNDLLSLRRAAKQALDPTLPPVASSGDINEQDERFLQQKSDETEHEIEVVSQRSGRRRIVPSRRETKKKRRKA